MQEFMDSIDFENMAKEYNLKYNNANILELNKKEKDDFDRRIKTFNEISSLFCFIKMQVKLLNEVGNQNNFLPFKRENNLHIKNNVFNGNINKNLGQNFSRIEFICNKIDEIENKIKKIEKK